MMTGAVHFLPPHHFGGHLLREPAAGARAKKLIGMLVTHGAQIRRRARPAVRVMLDVAGTRLAIGGQ